ncbi:hypothetical protein [Mesorhizobium sp. B2-4-17]|uniref:hypothetical protein n=1 Tax=Mesorhizobium sp. B2-4-17 TaxID=2589932 RepID=UPI001126647D|nr:hypothetical protein [Mesorhizobium sp. B2-4-17]TPK78199.1 hypothetical protein FJ548_25025 [Mesorhizobium sp. B2-4-17]
MATTKAYITATEVARAAAAAEKVAKARQAGRPADGLTVISDLSLKGLRLISASGIVSWAVKTSTHTKTIGYVYPKHEWPLTAPEKARELGGQVKALLKSDPEKVDAYLVHRHAGQTHDQALESLKPDATTWTLRECFNKTISDKLAPNAKNSFGEAQAADLRVTMKRPCFQTVLDTAAVIVTDSDIERVRNEVMNEALAKGQKGVRPCNKFVTHVRSVLDHCAVHHKGESGLGKLDRPWWRLVAALYKDPVRDRMPTIEEMVRTLVIAEEYLNKPLPGRAIMKEGVRAGALAGLWWLVLTVQRASAGMSLRSHDVVEDAERPGTGWMLAAWDKDVMKAGQSFVLPIPERAWKFIDGFRDWNLRGKSDDWAFPSEVKDDVHASVSGVYRILYRLSARDALIQKTKEEKPPRLRNDGTPWGMPVRTERRDLMAEAGIPWWSLHDPRRTLTAFMVGKKIPGAASAILAHEVTNKEGLKASATERQRADFLRQRTAKITAMAYGNESQFIELKSEAMLLWTDAVLDEYYRQKATAAEAEVAA